MTGVRIFTAGLMLGFSLILVIPGRAEEEKTELHKRNAFLAEYNWKKANERLAALGHLRQAQEQYSIDMLYHVSVMDPDPEVRSRAFFMLARCPDRFGATAWLAAESFKNEKEMGVKVEKAVAMSALRYRWSALNELVATLRTTRWSYWYGWGYGQGGGGYISDGTPPGEPGSDVKGDGGGEKSWRNGEPYRWHTENQLMTSITGSINRLSGTRMEPRPRLDQEIVKWWDRKSGLWADYDRKLRAKELGESQALERRKALKFEPKENLPAQDQFLKFLAHAHKDFEAEKRGEEKKTKGQDPDED